ncbi:beta-aspartyl-peptidase (threonine type) [Caulobacter ginsengisoli]|uniref:Beta-aspartyl-peptidase (Threonine type) n=1 Tax=Caulobacter ginsengisoli TaxID=400775 RepID=A0ABU0IV18_9CAUL|nr:isoaspartyl peptidase/L-asparaginase [Caulobacter ginsengisoli]MDQ0465845.1 beta-aspartyl-peptidase (threonine type) [Caulobacter ginsengisoli]
MIRHLRTLAILAALAVIPAAAPAAPPGGHWAIVIHGGAGVIERVGMDPATEAAYRAALARDLEVGSKILREGGNATDAVEAVIRELEDDPLFNAGRGAVFTAEGENSLDAAFMDGATLKAGAVAGVTRTRHPISLARSVMTNSRFVLLSGKGADTFAQGTGLEMVEPSFFFTERRWKQLEAELKAQGLPIPPRPRGAPPPPPSSDRPSAALWPADDHRFGTVGVVAADARGNVAAGTSTGGMTAKRWGRIGDSPILGAGTYADNSYGCAVSATGTGEYFIRLAIAHDVCARTHFQRQPLEKAAQAVIARLGAFGGDGGLIAVSPKGDMVWAFNTPGMYRAAASWKVAPVVKIYRDEK